MPTPPGKAGDLFVWFITSLFFLLILAGGTCLVLFLTLPDTEETAWLPVAGIVLVSIPWIFWIMTCIYRTIFPWCRPGDAGQSSPTGGPGRVDSLADSTGSERRVRFGAATVMDDSVDGAAGPGGEHEVRGQAHVVASNGSSTSLRSHESELPLAFSMS